MGTVVGYIIGTAVGVPMVAWLCWTIRAALVWRRRTVNAAGALESIPVRLRGVALAYPGFFRAGRLELASAQWRPNNPAGVPVSLAGARVWRGHVEGGLPRYARLEVLQTFADTQGRIFQVATFGPGDEDVAKQAITSHGPVSQPASAVISGAQRRVWLRWWRQRIPCPRAILVLLVIALGWIGYWLVPLIGASSLVVTVQTVPYPGSGSTECTVSWIDRTDGTNRYGSLFCGPTDQIGDEVTVSIVGWPRSGQLENPADDLVRALFPPGFVLLQAPWFVVILAYTRRQLARSSEPTIGSVAAAS